MQTTPETPAVEPVATETAAPVAAPDVTELRVTEQVSLDDAPPTVTPEPAAETPPPARRPNRHTEQMAEIVARRKERLAAERAEGHAQGFPDQQPLAEPSIAEAAPPLRAAAEPKAPESDAQAPPQVPAGPVRTHKILVRGNEIVMSDDDMRRAAELGVESEVRMRQANTALAEARRMAAASRQPIPSAGPSPPAATPQPAAEPPDNRDAMRELARELLYGDEEKVVDALSRTIRPAPAQPSIDPAALANEAYARLEGRLNLQNALQTFGSEYPEIINDPDLATLGANYVQQLRSHYNQTGTRRTELDLFREAGSLVRQSVQRWRGDLPIANPNPAPPASAVPSRVTIKRSMPQAPAASAAQQATPAPREKTGTDIVNEMRRARGQPVYT